MVGKALKDERAQPTTPPDCSGRRSRRLKQGLTNPVYLNAESAKPSVRRSLRSFVGKTAQDSIFTQRCSSQSPFYEDEIRSVEGGAALDLSAVGRLLRSRKAPRYSGISRV